MAKVEIIDSLAKEIQKKFKSESHQIVKLLRSLEENPKKGKPVGTVGGVVIKEIRYKKYRFYFVVDGHKIKVYDSESLKDLLIKFVRMSDKKSQQKVIDEIKLILRKFEGNGF
jgi:mRNA-degrading endonuclease RelE of RelBE toxin-antitoxin system